MRRNHWNYSWWLLPLFFWLIWGGGWWFFPLGFLFIFWILPMLFSAPMRLQWEDDLQNGRKYKNPGYDYDNYVDKRDRYQRDMRYAHSHYTDARRDAYAYEDEADYIETVDGERLRVVDDDGSQTRLTIG
jgi:hypothetical protein